MPAQTQRALQRERTPTLRVPPNLLSLLGLLLAYLFRLLSKMTSIMPFASTATCAEQSFASETSLSHSKPPSHLGHKSRTESFELIQVAPQVDARYSTFNNVQGDQYNFDIVINNHANRPDDPCIKLDVCSLVNILHSRPHIPLSGRTERS